VHTNDPPATPLLDHNSRCRTQAEERPAHIGVEDHIEIGKGGYLDIITSQKWIKDVVSLQSIIGFTMIRPAFATIYYTIRQTVW